MFIDRLCNPSDILLFKRRLTERIDNSDNSNDAAMENLFNVNEISMEDYMDEFFETKTEEKDKLSVLNIKDIGKSVKSRFSLAKMKMMLSRIALTKQLSL